MDEQESMEEKQEKQEERQPGRSVYEWVQALVCSVLAAVLLFTFGVRIVGVSGASMRETLQNGDMLLVVNGILCREYRQGDIVIAAKASFENGETIVKRVIATEGQTVYVDFVNGVVSVDGTALSEPYIREETHLSEGTEFPLTVPEGSIFVMGDNRNGSTDSRHELLGCIDCGYILGKVVLALWPLDQIGVF